jgi:hypothetical protein
VQRLEILLLLNYQNKTVSDPFDPLLQLQGMGWMMRKAISLATVTQYISSYEKDGITEIDIKQFVTGGIPASPEHRKLDWEKREHDDKIFGKVNGQSRFVSVANVEEGGTEDKEWLAEGWDEDGEKVESWVIGETGWKALQIWGFAVINGIRYHTRKVIVIKGTEKKKARLVYDYVGPLEE